jgi:hypothetical protein
MVVVLSVVQRQGEVDAGSGCVSSAAFIFTCTHEITPHSFCRPCVTVGARSHGQGPYANVQCVR